MPADGFKSLNQVFHLLLFTEDSLQLHNSIPKHLKTQTNTHLVACIQLENAAADGVNVRLCSSKQPVPRRTVWQRYLQQQPTTQTMQHYKQYMTRQSDTRNSLSKFIHTELLWWSLSSSIWVNPPLSKKNWISETAWMMFWRRGCQKNTVTAVKLSINLQEKIRKIHNPLNISSNYRVHRTAGL